MSIVENAATRRTMALAALLLGLAASVPALAQTATTTTPPTAAAGGPTGTTAPVTPTTPATPTTATPAKPVVKHYVRRPVRHAAPPSATSGAAEAGGGSR